MVSYMYKGLIYTGSLKTWHAPSGLLLPSMNICHACLRLLVTSLFRPQAASLQDKAAQWVSSAARKARARTAPLGGDGDEQPAAPGARKMLAEPAGPAGSGVVGSGGAGEGARPALQLTAADAAAAAGALAACLAVTAK